MERSERRFEIRTATSPDSTPISRRFESLGGYYMRHVSRLAEVVTRRVGLDTPRDHHTTRHGHRSG